MVLLGPARTEQDARPIVGRGDDSSLGVPAQEAPPRRRSDAAELWARARGSVDVGRPATGIRLAERALHEIDRHATRDPVLRARVLLVLADAHVELGEISRAEELLHDAEAAGPAVAPVVRASRGVLLARTGRMRPARRELDTAIGELERTNPAGSNLVRALLWRGLLHLTESRLDEAAADCEAARQLGSRRGMDAAVVIATHTEGIVHFLSGDLPGALHLMSQADEQPLDVRVGFRALDRARVLLAAGLTAEARDFARRAGEAFVAERARVDLAETLLVQAEIDLMDRRPPRAALAASRAARIYAGAHHARGVLAARLMHARADALDRVVSRIRDRRRARADAARAATLADDLAATGLVEDARAARVLEADARLAAGDLDQAEQTLARARSESAAQFVAVPTVATELHGRLVAARTELARGRPVAGMSQMRRGLDDLASFQARFGSQDLQSAAAVHGFELTRLGLRTALESRSPAAILQWLERSRGASTRLPAVRPPVDPALAKDLSRLRVAAYRARQASRSGAPDAELDSIVQDLRRRVRSRSWTAGGSGSVHRPLTLAAVQRRLAQMSPRVSIVAPFRGRGQFHALIITAGTARYLPVEPGFALEELLHLMVGDLNILADHRIRPELRVVAERSLQVGLGKVAAAIVDPIQPFVDDGPVIVAASGAAAIVPWALLPGLTGRALSVTTSVTAAVANLGERRLDHDHGVLAVAGPDVPRRGARGVGGGRGSSRHDAAHRAGRHRQGSARRHARGRARAHRRARPARAGQPAVLRGPARGRPAVRVRRGAQSGAAGTGGALQLRRRPDGRPAGRRAAGSGRRAAAQRRLDGGRRDQPDLRRRRRHRDDRLSPASPHGRRPCGRAGRRDPGRRRAGRRSGAVHVLRRGAVAAPGLWAHDCRPRTVGPDLSAHDCSRVPAVLPAAHRLPSSRLVRFPRGRGGRPEPCTTSHVWSTRAVITQWILLGVGVVLIAGTALYVAAEFSLVTVDRATVARQAAEGDGRAMSLQAGLRSLSTQLSGAQVGITVTTLALGFVAEPSLASLLSVPLQWLGLAADVAGSISVVIALVVATVMSMVFGELVPKNIAIAEPLPTAKSVITPMRVSTTIFYPLIWVLNGTANAVLRLIGVQPQEELRSARSAGRAAVAGSPIGGARHARGAHRRPARAVDRVLRQDRRRRPHARGSGCASSVPPTPRMRC